MLLTYRFISLKRYHLVLEHFGVIFGISTSKFFFGIMAKRGNLIPPDFQLMNDYEHYIETSFFFEVDLKSTPSPNYPPKLKKLP